MKRSNKQREEDIAKIESGLIGKWETGYSARDLTEIIENNKIGDLEDAIFCFMEDAILKNVAVAYDSFINERSLFPGFESVSVYWGEGDDHYEIPYSDICKAIDEFAELDDDEQWAKHVKQAIMKSFSVAEQDTVTDE